MFKSKGSQGKSKHWNIFSKAEAVKPVINHAGCISEISHQKLLKGSPAGLSSAQHRGHVRDNSTSSTHNRVQNRQSTTTFPLREPTKRMSHQRKFLSQHDFKQLKSQHDKADPKELAFYEKLFNADEEDHDDGDFNFVDLQEAPVLEEPIKKEPEVKDNLSLALEEYRLFTKQQRAQESKRSSMLPKSLDDTEKQTLSTHSSTPSLATFESTMSHSSSILEVSHSLWVGMSEDDGFEKIPDDSLQRFDAISAFEDSSDLTSCRRHDYGSIHRTSLSFV